MKIGRLIAMDFAKTTLIPARVTAGWITVKGASIKRENRNAIIEEFFAAAMTFGAIKNLVAIDTVNASIARAGRAALKTSRSLNLLI